MLGWAFVFLLVAMIAAIFSYRAPSTSTYIAKLIFYFSIFIFILLLFAAIFSSAPPQPGTKFF